jgi:hypothetical protein
VPVVRGRRLLVHTASSKSCIGWSARSIILDRLVYQLVVVVHHEGLLPPLLSPLVTNSEVEGCVWYMNYFSC